MRGVSFETRSLVQFPTGVVWNVWVPPKVSFFVWDLEESFDSQLQRRGWSLTNHRFLCLGHGDSIYHIFLHCGKAKVLWELLFSLFRVYWVMQFTVRETLLG